MIGLSYILKISDITERDLSKNLNIRQQNIDLWINDKTRKIPKKWLSQLSKIFNMDIEYFQKELTELDKLKLQKLRLVEDCNKLGLKLEEV
jgi:hypothetical protein